VDNFFTNVHVLVSKFGRVIYFCVLRIEKDVHNIVFRRFRNYGGLKMFVININLSTVNYTLQKWSKYNKY